MSESSIDTAAIVGLGLIGGSMALVLREQGLVKQIHGCDLSGQTCIDAVQSGVVDRAFATVREAIKGADLIVLAVPVLSVEPVLVTIRDQLWDKQGPNNARLIITDVGSVKREICAAAERVFGELPSCLVPGHPIAGSEQHGLKAARSDLFVDHRVILTPHGNSSEYALFQVERLWRAAGAEVIRMDVGHHDAVLAGTSHLPHLLAYALVDTLSSTGDQMENFKYAAGGFRDFTRIAASDPIMWSDIFSTNGPAVVDILDTYMKGLTRLRQAITEDDTQTLIETFSRAKAARDYFTSLNTTHEAD